MTNKAVTNFLVKPGGTISGELVVPGDKSISHRALMLGAIAEGTTTIKGFLQGEDTLATARAFRQMGVDIENDGDIVKVHGVGLHGLSGSDTPIDLGNSGTSVRLMAGLLSGQSFDSELIGDDSLMSRPMRRIVDPLKLMNAEIHCSKEGTLPLQITATSGLKSINFEMPVASAQLKSSLLLAGLYADGTTKITEPKATRDHTERMLSVFSHPVEKEKNQISVSKAEQLIATEVIVPADFSSAAFFIVAALIVPGSDVLLKNVGINPTRNAMLEILKEMGANIELINSREQSGELVAELRIKSSDLKGIDIPENLVPIAIDEFPIIFIAAACATGTSRLTGAAELRVKESDRLQAMSDGLQTTGIKARTTEDGMIIDGGQFTGGSVNSFGDHRIAMAFAVAGMVADSPIKILDCENVATSFPGFVDLARNAGMDIDYD